LKLGHGLLGLETAKSFQKLWEEIEKHIEPTVGYLETAASHSASVWST
jgi:hypothetical protein